MAIERSTGALFGTDESTLDTVANNTIDNGAEVDVLGNDASAGTIRLYMVLTSTVTAGAVEVKVSQRRVTGEAYKARSSQFYIQPINGTQKFVIGVMDASRYMQVDVFNNATGADANVFIGYELYKVS